MADIRIRPVGRGRFVPPAERVDWRPLLGPGADGGPAEPTGP
jgi:hypothetical protein